LEEVARPKERLSVTLTMEDGKKLDLVFGDNDQPTVWRGSKGYKLSTNTWDTLTDAVTKI
jgi:hypothetical protein